MTGLPAFIRPAKRDRHFFKIFATLELESRNLNACLSVLDFSLVASVITTDFVTLTVTLFVKEALKPVSTAPFPPRTKNYFRQLPIPKNNFQKLFPRVRVAGEGESLRTARVLC